MLYENMLFEIAFVCFVNWRENTPKLA